VIILAVAVLLAFFVEPGPAWYVAMIGVLLILLAVELLNTAVEKDHVTPEHHTEIGIIKDAAFYGRVLPGFACWTGMACGDRCALWTSLDIRQALPSNNSFSLKVRS
jgi:diacylglycerol kinase